MAVPSKSVIDLFRHSQDTVTFADGQVIFEENEPGKLMYVVQDGLVELRVRGHVVATLEAGDILGEMALIDDKPRSATAVAKRDSRLIPIDERRFQYLVQQTPFFALLVMRVMAERLRRMDEQL